LVERRLPIGAITADRLGIENGLRNDQGKPSISVSIGVGIYPDDGQTAPELIEAADQQLYKYKRTENSRTTSAQAQLNRTKRASR